MPKIIENLPARLSAEARRQILESGYAAFNIRSLAQRCGVGTGTVYSYFPSKDALIASFLLEDWQACLARVRNVSETENSASATVSALYQEICAFMRRYQGLFQSTASQVSASFHRYHVLLRGQLAAILRPYSPDEFTAQFIAEALLAWAGEEKELPELYAVIQKLLK